MGLGARTVRRSQPVAAIAGVAVAAAAIFAGLAYAMRGLPTGTAYAVWVGIGATLTAGYAMWTCDEPASAARVLLLVGIVGCVIGIKVVQ